MHDHSSDEKQKQEKNVNFNTNIADDFELNNTDIQSLTEDYNKLNKRVNTLQTTANQLNCHIDKLKLENTNYQALLHGTVLLSIDNRIYRIQAPV